MSKKRTILTPAEIEVANLIRASADLEPVKEPAETPAEKSAEKPAETPVTPESHVGLLTCAGERVTIEASDAAKPKRFSMVAYTGAPMQLKGWYHPVVVDLAGMNVPRQSVPVDHNHDTENQVVGHTESVEKTPQRLYATGVLSGHSDTEQNPSAQAARKITAMAGQGFPWQASITASPDKMEFLDKGEKSTVNGRTVSGPAYVARASTLKAISIVALGADGNTSTTVAASDTGEATVNYEAWLKARGIDDVKALPEAVQKTLKASFDAEVKPPATAVPPAVATPAPDFSTQAAAEFARLMAKGQSDIAEIREQGRAEIQAQREKQVKELARQKAILLVCAKHPDLTVEVEVGDKKEKVKVPLDQHAIEANWDEQATELYALRFEREKFAGNVKNAPFGYAVSAPEQIGVDVLTAAALQASGYSFRTPDVGSRELDNDYRPPLVADNSFDEKTLEAAHKRFRSRISLQELLIEAAHLGGFKGRLHRLHDDQAIAQVLRCGFQMIEAADGFSTASLPGILSNLQNKFLLQGYWSINMAYRQISAIRSVKDFKQTSSYNLTGDFTYRLVGPDGEIQHASIGEETFNNQVDTYGRVQAITRAMIVNDDLGALTQIPMKLGRGSALAINKVFWTAFLAASVGSVGTEFFTSGTVSVGKQMKPNYFLGAATNLQSSSLATAEQMFNEQVDPNGDPLGVMAKYLLVPPALRVTASELNNSTKVVGPTSSKQPDTNVFNGLYQPVFSPYLSNSAFSGNSSTAWYLLADPMDMPFIETAFLNGQETPTVRTFEVSPGQLGITMEGFHDFGVSLQNRRGAVRSKGAA